MRAASPARRSLAALAARLCREPAWLAPSIDPPSLCRNAQRPAATPTPTPPRPTLSDRLELDLPRIELGPNPDDYDINNHTRNRANIDSLCTFARETNLTDLARLADGDFAADVLADLGIEGFNVTALQEADDLLAELARQASGSASILNNTLPRLLRELNRVQSDLFNLTETQIDEIVAVVAAAELAGLPLADVRDVLLDALQADTSVSNATVRALLDEDSFSDPIDLLDIALGFANASGEDRGGGAPSVAFSTPRWGHDANGASCT